MVLAGAALAGAVASSAASPPSPAEATFAEAQVERRLMVMGTELTVRVEADSRLAALRASEAAVGALEATEARLSTWRRDSELARLNGAPAGEPFSLSPALAQELAAAQGCWRETEGAFDPTVGALLEAWDLRRGGHRPEPSQMAKALAATGMELLSLAGDASTGPLTAVRRHPDLRLEEGGLGKGAGLAKALDLLRQDPEVRRASLDLGGQVALTSRRPGDTWRLTVAHPGHRHHAVIALQLPAGSLATSGTSEKGRHILDPRSGEPAPAFGSITVWSEDPLLADCLSTGLFVLGSRRALEWAAARPGVEVLVLEEREGRLAAQVTPGLALGLEALEAKLEVEVYRTVGRTAGEVESVSRNEPSQDLGRPREALEKSQEKRRAVGPDHSLSQTGRPLNSRGCRRAVLHKEYTCSLL
jgi:thiamine biosynthesis lipoprotein